MKTNIVIIASIFIMIFMSFQVVKFEGFAIPENFPDPQYKFIDNSITQENFELGKKLFYDPVLSRNNTISCGSCHIQSSAFTQHGHDISHGIDDRLGNRNTPPIMNLAWNKSFFWDGGVFHLDMFSISPITNPVEMDENLNNVLAKLRQKGDYRLAFKAVYGSDEITANQLFKSLSAFMLLCISSNSKYDSVMRKTGVTFTERERKGYSIFQKHCNNCHTEPLFTDGSFRNNGLSTQFNKDIGRQLITQDENDKYKFKVPSLRNLSYTAPYMHDGRFSKIDMVLNHYSKGIENHPTIDPLLKQNGTLGISLTTEEKEVLKVFLKTLDDKYFITRKDLSE
ncbi:cytochrome-c peroxidase [Flavobacterium sp. UMI-01]|uniref:cytochrome-c peroxidase n=1 Tax=Flavobacterium sp. UMI-01 TaxID=1441053 RepID=UPI001C7DDCE3|nr:cytochrome c peroxidase [Flavobacterium sp. UMI-01]GIZ09037.1 cytochrome-c peroxidase [Flavobacterium sp. UMI-01]